MLKRFFILILSVMLFAASLSLQSVWAQTSSDADRAATARVKVEKLGVGQNARVAVKLRDNSRLKGYISATDQDSFTVTDRKTGLTTSVAYTDVAEVKKPGSGLSTKSWIIIGSLVAGAAVTWSAVKPVLCDGGAQTRGLC